VSARRLVLACAVAAAGCGDSVTPFDVSSGRMTARIWADTPKIELLVDGAPVWTTVAGSRDGGKGKAPYAFAAVGTLSVTIEEQFGSYKFTEDTNAERWQIVDRLGDLAATADGATFTLWSNDRAVGTGALSFVTSTRAGPDPTAAGFPGQVRLQLAAAAGDRIALAAPCGRDEHFVGLGGQSWDVDHRGWTVPLWVQEDGISKDPSDDYSGVWPLVGRRHSTHTPMPMVLSSAGYAIAVDTDARAVFELGSAVADATRFEAWERTLDLQIFVGAGDTPARDALATMSAWAGKPDAPDPVVFSPWIDAIFGSASVRQVATALRANGISSSVIWTEDWRGASDTPGAYVLHENWRVDRTLYPDFEQLATDLHDAGFAFLTYNNTFIDSAADIYAEATAPSYSIHDGSGAIYSFEGVKFEPSTMLDLSNPSGVAWAQSVMGEGLAAGADGWMADYGEWLPVDAALASGDDARVAHNRYPVEWARYNHDLLATTPSGRPRPIYFMRSAWLHSQPLVQVMWAGDQQTDFSLGDGFPSVIPIGIGLGVTGFPYFGSDIGGYQTELTVPTSEELFYRWTTLGALSPVMRTHHGRAAHDTFQWQHDASSIAHFRRWARFHQQLAAYLAGSVASFQRDGLPLFRLVALDFPYDDWAWSSTDEYLLGDRILVAPIIVQGDTARDVQLPSGTWLPLLGGAAVTGAITASAPTTEIPAFVPAGALLVLYPDGVDTVYAAPALSGATTLSSVGGDREVWLWPGAAIDPATASWHDALGTTATAPQWSWSGRAASSPAPTSATWNGAPVAWIAGPNYATTIVTGDGTLALADGGTLVIARGLAAANVTVRVYAGN
jgi:alpha-glucosidase (family GH31 glycosyl hydrolase)